MGNEQSPTEEGHGYSTVSYHFQNFIYNNLYLCQQLVEQYSLNNPRNLKGGIESLFDHCANAMGRRPYIDRHVWR